MAHTSRLALIGKGRWGSVIKETLLTIPTCELICEATHDWKLLRERNDIDGVIIATPPITHTEIALAFIKRHVPVFIEKPMTTTVADAEKIEAAARENGTPVMVGHIHLYNGAFLKTKKLSRECGPIRLLIGEGGNNGPFRNDYSVLWDWAPHDLSMILEVLEEEPLSVQAWAVATTRPGTTLWDSTKIKLVFSSGAVAFISNTWLSPEKQRRLTIIGEKNSIVYDDVLPEKKIRLYEGMGPQIKGVSLTRLEPRVSYPSYDSTLPLTRELETFVDVIKTGSQPKSDVRLGTHIVKLIDAAERSISSNGVPIMPQAY